GDDWHEGVVGIVAARVGRTFEKPTIVLTKSKEGNLKGSGRSFHICNLFKITESCRELLDKFGGHHAAIGLTLPLKNLEPFKKKLQQNYLNENYNEAYSDPDVLGILNFSEINFDLTNMMRQYEPFGQGNPRPKFVTHNVIIQEVVSMGKEKEHRRFTFAHNGAILQGVMFKTDALFQVFDRVSVVYTINENHFNNRINLQLMVEKVL
ncbi:MAG TPA: single-stranded-DNA-specific exonuclease RecJ, partial [Campylobacterales bacterium]|nr:single-stranded-DNA-specific exonuclease RecJ [Campylobacterales bacterium]